MGNSSSSTKMTTETVMNFCQNVTNETIIKAGQATDSIVTVNQEIIIEANCDDYDPVPVITACISTCDGKPDCIEKCDELRFCNKIVDSTVTNKGTVKVLNVSKMDQKFMQEVQASMDAAIEEKKEEINSELAKISGQMFEQVGALIDKLPSFGDKDDETDISNLTDTDVKMIMRDTLNVDFHQDLKTILTNSQKLVIKAEGGGNLISNSGIENDTIAEAISQAFQETDLGKALKADMDAESKKEEKKKDSGFVDFAKNIGDDIGGVFSSGIWGTVIVIVVALIVALGFWYVLAGSESLQSTVKNMKK